MRCSVISHRWNINGEKLFRVQIWSVNMWASAGFYLAKDEDTVRRWVDRKQEEDGTNTKYRVTPIQYAILEDRDV